MKTLLLDEKWTFRRGLLDSLGIIDSYKAETVNLPHDGMIGLPVDKNAQAVTDSGYVSFGKENRITVNLNTGVQPSCRWYTGSGLFRGVKLCHGPKIHIAENLKSVEISLLVETGKQDAGK